MIVKHKLIADITNCVRIPRIDAVQDDKYSRDLEIRLQENGLPFTPPQGCRVLIRYRKADGTGGVYDTLPNGSEAWTLAEDVLTVALAPEICTAPGSVQLAVSMLLEESELCCVRVQVDVKPLPGFLKTSRNYLNVANFVPQPQGAKVGQYLKVTATDASGRVIVTGTDSGASTVEIADAVELEHGAAPTVTELESSTVWARIYRLGIPKGEPGAAPVCGTDYWTEADKEAILDELHTYICDQMADISQAEILFANTIEECSDTTKVYVLPDGYLYAYMNGAAGTNFTNLSDPSSSDWVEGYRINSSGMLTAASGVLITNFIDVANTTLLHIQGLDIISDMPNGGNYGRVYAYDADKNLLTGVAQPNVKPAYFYTADYDSSVTIADLESSIGYWFSSYDVRYVRLGGFLTVDTADEVIITADKQITFTEAGSAWRSTGHAFIPADYEDRILSLEAQTAKHSTRLDTLETPAGAYPEYWQEAVSTAITKVKAIQDEGGKDTVSFLWFSDMHYTPDSAHVANIGALCNAVMDACNIPYALMCGDTMSAAVVDSEEKLLNWLEGAAQVLSPIGSHRLLQIRGNHDDVYGRTTVDGATAYYVNKVAPAKIWNRIHRHQARDASRVFGGDGTYFYLDNAPQKVRFVCLNSHFYDADGITDGTVNAMSYGFGDAQLEWLRDTALVTEDGWDVIIATHIPPAATAINGTVYLHQYGDGETFRSIIRQSEANILGIFCGHCHADGAVSDDLPCPIVTVTCAINTPYDGTAAGRVAGTDQETAIDIVSINRASGTIHTTRLGAGNDRQILL